MRVNKIFLGDKPILCFAYDCVKVDKKFHATIIMKKIALCFSQNM